MPNTIPHQSLKGLTEGKYESPSPKAQFRGLHTALSSHFQNKSVFSDYLKRLHDKSGCLRSVGR